MEKYNLEITYQPLNKCWGVLFQKENNIHNEVNENLTIAFAEMAKYIEGLSEMKITYGNEDVLLDLRKVVRF